MQPETVPMFEPVADDGPPGPIVDHPAPPPDDEQKPLGDRLRELTTPCRVHHTQLGVRRALSNGQLTQAAATFGADARMIGAAKKLLDTRHPAVRKVTRIRHDATGYWRSVSAPYPEPGMRLIRRSRVGDFEARMMTYRNQLAGAVAELEAKYHELRNDAEERLGALFNPADYPDSLADHYSLSWDYPSADPPAYLKQVAPELYEAERARIRARMEESLKLTEDALAAELAKVVSHLVDRLAGDDDGKAKVFRDSAIENATAFFERFAELRIVGSSALDSIVADARSVLAGIDPKRLRKSETLREHVAGELAKVSATLDGLMVDRGRAIALDDDTEGPF